MRSVLAAGALGLAVFQPGCNTGPAKGPSGITERETEVVHEDCPIGDAGSERLDANGDGRADVSIVRTGRRPLCRAVDLNFDGLPDVWTYFDPDGRVRRRETDYDRDGRVDEISLFRAGVLREQQRATSLHHKLDTWEFYERGKLARTERDSDGDRIVDQWWEHASPECPIIHTDVNRDGRPEPNASLDYCKDTGYVPPERQDYRRPEGPSFEQSTPTPTEVDSQPQAPEAPPKDEKP